MARINLLPWREALRNEKQQEFFIMLGVFAAITAGILGAIHFYNTQLIEHQQLRNNFLTEQTKLLEKKIVEIKELEKEKQRLLDRMRAIEQLQGNRPLIVRFFDELISSLPEGVSVTSITQKGQSVTIVGEAQSNARVSSFMRKLDASKWLKDPQLDIIQAKNESGTRISNFTLRFTQVIPKASDEEEDA
ncbi:MAG: PilN domain-containing protein [Gammaproteobacteria bacterium]